MAFLGKEYKFEKQENFDKFLKAAGLPDEQVQKFVELKPVSKLVKNGDTYTYSTSSPDGVRETNFKSGVEFSDNFQGKIPITTTYTVEGNKVTQLLKTAMGEASIVREYNGDELVMTMSSPKFDIVAKRWYKA